MKRCVRCAFAIGCCQRDAIPFDSLLTMGMAFAFFNLHFVRCDRGE
jgi:hypothetical protein